MYYISIAEDVEFLSWQLWVHAGYNTAASTELLKEFISKGADVNCCLKPSITENMKPDQVKVGQPNYCLHTWGSVVFVCVYVHQYPGL